MKKFEMPADSNEAPKLTAPAFTRKPIETAFMRESNENPAHVEPTAENVTIRSPRESKASVARQANETLQAAIRAEDWKSAQASADVVSQMARWLQLSDEQVSANS